MWVTSIGNYAGFRDQTNFNEVGEDDQENGYDMADDNRKHEIVVESVQVDYGYYVCDYYQAD